MWFLQEFIMSVFLAVSTPHNRKRSAEPVVSGKGDGGGSNLQHDDSNSSLQTNGSTSSQQKNDSLSSLQPSSSFSSPSHKEICMFV